MPLTTPDACYSKSSSQTSSNNLFNTIDKMGSKEIICFPVPRNKSKAEHGNTFTLWVKVMAPIEIKAFKDELIFSVLSCLNQAHAYRHENSLPSHVGTEPFYCCLSPSSSWQRPLLHRQTQRLYWQKRNTEFLEYQQFCLVCFCKMWQDLKQWWALNPCWVLLKAQQSSKLKSKI